MVLLGLVIPRISWDKSQPSEPDLQGGVGEGKPSPIGALLDTRIGGQGLIS